MDTNKFVVADGTGNTTIAGTLGVTGATTLAGALTVDSINPIGSVLSLGSIAPFSTMNIGTDVQSINIGTGTSGTINIGQIGSTINIIGNVINNITNLDIENKNIFFNGNAAGSNTARNAGIFIRDANDNQKAYIITSNNGDGYLLKAPESNNVLNIDNSNFNISGFVKTTLLNGNSDLSAAVIQISDVDNLQANLDSKLNLSGGTITGSIW